MTPKLYLISLRSKMPGHTHTECQDKADQGATS